VRGKGAKEATVPLPRVARIIFAEYSAADRPDADPTTPLFLAVYQNRVGRFVRTRISGHRVWKLTQSIGERAEIKGFHPHALRHACAVELPRRTKNLRAVQEHLRHADIGTTIYARLPPQDLQEIVTVFDV
jgi:site-specific recombinase XerD